MADIDLGVNQVELIFHDTREEDNFPYRRLRKVYLFDADVILLCFALDMPQTFIAVTDNQVGCLYCWFIESTEFMKL
jgi:hypothetical protein